MLGRDFICEIITWYQGKAWDFLQIPTYIPLPKSTGFDKPRGVQLGKVLKLTKMPHNSNVSIN